MRIPTLRAGLATSAAVAAVVAGSARASPLPPPVSAAAPPVAAPARATPREGLLPLHVALPRPVTGATDRAPDGYLARDSARHTSCRRRGERDRRDRHRLDVPNAEKDLAVYRKAQRPAACTTANGCFTGSIGRARRRTTRPRTAVGPSRVNGPRHGLGGLPDLQDPPSSNPDDNYNDNLAAATRTASRPRSSRTATAATSTAGCGPSGTPTSTLGDLGRLQR